MRNLEWDYPTNLLVHRKSFNVQENLGFEFPTVGVTGAMDLKYRIMKMFVIGLTSERPNVTVSPLNISEELIKQPSIRTMEMTKLWTAVLLTMSFVNFWSHFLGFYLLMHLYMRSKHTVQRLSLIHLSALVALKNLLFIPCLSMELMGLVDTSVQQYMDVCLTSVIPLLYYSLITFITVDR